MKNILDVTTLLLTIHFKNTKNIFSNQIDN